MSEQQWRHLTEDEMSVNKPIIAKGVAPLFERIEALEKQVHRLRTFAEEMSWYAPEEDWEDAAQRLLRYGDVHTIAEIREANAKGQGDEYDG